MKLETILNLGDFRITDGSEYLWKCYPSARFVTLASEYAEISVIHSTVSGTVYEVTVCVTLDHEDEGNPLPAYRWIHPEWKAAYEDEAHSRNIDPKICYDDVNWVDLELEDDFLSKARDMFGGKFDFDKRVQIELDLPDDLFVVIARQAHKLDITFNQYISRLLDAELPKLIAEIELAKASDNG